MKKDFFSDVTPRKKAWLLTLMDLMMLMLTFFVLLYSMSTPTAKTTNNAFFDNTSLDEYPIYPHGIHINYLEQILAQKIKDFDGYKIYKEAGVLRIQIPQRIFADVKNRIVFDEDKKRIQRLGEQLNNISNKLFLQVGNGVQPTQEALLQASVIANLLKQGGYPFNLRIVQRNDIQNDFIQIVIFPTIRKEI